MLELAGDLHVDGIIEGVVHTEFDISVGSRGKVSGLVKANNIAVSGCVEGKVACKRVDILNGGKLLGNVICNEMMIESGGRFIGESREMSDDGVVVNFPELEAFSNANEQANDDIEVAQVEDMPAAAESTDHSDKP